MKYGFCYMYSQLPNKLGEVERVENLRNGLLNLVNNNVIVHTPDYTTWPARTQR